MNKPFLILISLLSNFYEMNACAVHDQRENMRLEFEIIKIQAAKHYEAYENFGKDFESCEIVMPDFELAAFYPLSYGHPTYCQEQEVIVEVCLNDIGFTNDEIKHVLNSYKKEIEGLKYTIQVYTSRLIGLKKRYRK